MELPRKSYEINGLNEIIEKAMKFLNLHMYQVAPLLIFLYQQLWSFYSHVLLFLPPPPCKCRSLWTTACVHYLTSQTLDKFYYKERLAFFPLSNSYFYSFVPNVISLRNSSPEYVVCAPSLSVFKQSLHHFFLYFF